MITGTEADYPRIAYKVCRRRKSKATEEPEQPAEEGEGDADEHRERCSGVFESHNQYFSGVQHTFLDVNKFKIEQEGALPT